jgi:hypothetical protein
MSLGQLAAEFDALEVTRNSLKTEIVKRLGGEVPVVAEPKVKKPKVGRKKKEGDKSFPSLKEVVQTILGKNPEGLDLKAIANEVDAMIKRGEYASNAKSLPAVVAQALNALKQEDLLNHDKESKKYSLVTKAA